MAVPLTLGSLRTKIVDMQIGDYIAFRYKASNGTTAGAITEVGASVVAELPYLPVTAPDGTAYFVKADKGLLIADRNVHLISATAFDSNNMFYSGNPNTDMGINFSGGTFNVLDATKDGMTVYASHTFSNATTYSPGRAFGSTGATDGDRWIADNGVNQWLKFDFGVGRKELLGAFTFLSTYAGCQPKAWKFYGSNDDLAWDLIQDMTDSKMSAVNTQYYFEVTPIQAYRYFKWEFTANNGYANGRYDLGDIKFFRSTFGIDGILRVLDGGCTYANDRGEKALSFNATYGASPSHNEWEKYICKSDLGGRITVGDDNVWHYSPKESWTQNMWNEFNTAGQTYRIVRGASPINRIFYGDASSTSITFGYRPAFEYQEVI